MHELDLEEIVRKSSRLHSGGAIYFLIDDDEIVYIGQSTSILGRLYEHSMRKEFDSYFVLPVDRSSDLDDVERFYLHKFRPRYNKSFQPVSKDFMERCEQVRGTPTADVKR